jgi:hypothetical protein
MTPIIKRKYIKVYQRVRHYNNLVILTILTQWEDSDHRKYVHGYCAMTWAHYERKAWLWSVWPKHVVLYEKFVNQESDVWTVTWEKYTRSDNGNSQCPQILNHLRKQPDSESSQKTIVLSIRTAFETTSTFYDTQCRNAFCYSKGRGNVIYLKMKSQGKYLELGNKRYCEFEIYMTMTAMIYTLLVTGYLMSWVTEWKTKNTTILVRSLFESTLFQIPRE